MDWLEEELKQALARKEPSRNFEARVGAVARNRSNVAIMSRRWMAAAAAVIVMVSAGEGYRWHRGQVAKDQVMLAMRIAGGKLNRVQVEIARERQ
jgi:hypothetical protein